MSMYIDEFQNFTTDSVAYLISEARKHGLRLTLANQNLSQLNANTGRQSVLDTIIGNVGTILMMRIGAMDAEKLQTYTKPELTAEDLQELPDFHVAARMLVNNVPHRPFVFKTLPMPVKSGGVDVEQIIANSRNRYALPKVVVEEEITKKMMSSGLPATLRQLCSANSSAVIFSRELCGLNPL
jgi:hypothetical protein